ncbi:hypothetical protein WG66_001957 [Moniliophthora roreri]|nr:hypothetical protein WG66_001957 [Moniliophthora roreri]
MTRLSHALPLPHAAQQVLILSAVKSKFALSECERELVNEKRT